VTSKREYDAAYFTLLRAVEERDDLLRYHEALEAEAERLDAFTQATHEVDGALPRKLRRPLGKASNAVRSLRDRLGLVPRQQPGRAHKNDGVVDTVMIEATLGLQVLRENAEDAGLLAVKECFVGVGLHRSCGFASVHGSSSFGFYRTGDRQPRGASVRLIRSAA
jgi:hypothetical protein